MVSCAHGQIAQMKPISADEFTRMERLMANLLPDCTAEEEAALLTLHQRLEAIYASQSDLNASRSRLTALQSRTAR